MILFNHENYGRENCDYSQSESESIGSQIENPRQMDDDTFHEDPEDEEDDVSNGSDNNSYNSYNDDTEETEDDFDEENFDEDEDLNDDFNDNSYNPDDFDTASANDVGPFVNYALDRRDLVKSEKWAGS